MDSTKQKSDATEWDLDLSEQAKGAEERELEGIRYVAQLDEQWLKKHNQRAKALEDKLTEDSPHAGASDRLLAKLIAHECALSETLCEAEVKLAQRILTMADNCKVALSLAKALRETTICRSSAQRRIQQLMETRVILRGQRRLAAVVPLRRVA